MPLPPGEPTTAEAVQAWISDHVSRRDRFRHVYQSSEEHRLRHGGDCSVHPTGSGPLLGALAAATGAKRILELGCGLGYSALWLAYGSAPEGRVETIEQVLEHSELARRNFEREGLADRITVHVGRGAQVLAGLDGKYDLIFADSDVDEYLIDLEHFMRLLRRGGLLYTSNLFLGRYSPDIAGLEVAAAYRARVLEDERLLTTFAGGAALSVRR